MYLRIWKPDGSIADRPMRLIDRDDGPHAEWKHDPDDRGTVTLTAVQLFNDDGTTWSERQSCGPWPWQVCCDADDGPPEGWVFRMPVTVPH